MQLAFFWVFLEVTERLSLLGLTHRLIHHHDWHSVRTSPFIKIPVDLLLALLQALHSDREHSATSNAIFVSLLLLLYCYCHSIAEPSLNK